MAGGREGGMVGAWKSGRGECMCTSISNTAQHKSQSRYVNHNSILVPVGAGLTLIHAELRQLLVSAFLFKLVQACTNKLRAEPV